MDAIPSERAEPGELEAWLCATTTDTTHKHIHNTHTVTRKLCYSKDDRAMRAIYVDRELL